MNQLTENTRSTQLLSATPSTNQSTLSTTQTKMHCAKAEIEQNSRQNSFVTTSPSVSAYTRRQVLQKDVQLQQILCCLETLLQCPSDHQKTQAGMANSQSTACCTCDFALSFFFSSTGCIIKSSPPRFVGSFLSNGREFQCEILYTYLLIMYLHAVINSI